MSIFTSITAFLRAFFRIKIFRFVIIIFAIFAVLYVVLAYTLVPFLLTKAIKENYYLTTGHSLQTEDVSFSPFDYTFGIKRLKDSAGLWQAESVFIDIAFLQSLRQLNVVVNELHIDKFSAKPQQRENGEWDFADVLTHFTKTTKINAARQPSSRGSPVIIKKISFSKADITTNALVLNNLPLVISPLDITLTDIDLRSQKLSKLVLNATINKTIPLTIKGSVNIHTTDAELDVALNAVPIKWFNSALNPYVALEVLDGFLNTSTHLSLKDGALQIIKSNGNLTALKLRPKNREQDVVKLQRLAWSDVVVSLTDKTVHASLMQVDEFDGQFIIHKDRTNNIQAMLLKPVALDTQEKNAAPLDEGLPRADSLPPVQWKFNLERVAINNAALGFYDQSLTPSFMVIVQQFTGEIIHLSNNEQQFAEVNLAGNVDGTAPVTLSGKVQPFTAIPQMDVLFSFQKLDMGALTPYSAEYAGWRIKKGLLSVDLHYRLEQQKIVGHNHVVIERLEFGEKVRSANAIDIPLRLGLALLTDENGVAVLDAEISGDPKAPNFNMRTLFVKALRNTFKKVITSPFRFLSKLIQTNEDLGAVTFASGESQLNEPAITKLHLLAQVLEKRPTLRLDIQGTYNAVADEQSLKMEQINTILQKQGISTAAIKDHNLEWEKAVAEYYQAQGLTMREADATQKYQELASLQTVTQERLHRLAHERALAVKQYFVLNLNVASEKLLLNSALECEKVSKCLTSEVIFSVD